jgi:hypothetical protein
MQRGRILIFTYNLAMLGVLVALLIAYYWQDPAGHFLPEDIRDLPAQAIWAGSLGGVVISLKGVYDHRVDWDDSWILWHVGRPFSAAAVGGLTFILLLAVNTGDDEPVAPLSNAVVCGTAFVLGTQEKRFFNWLYQVASVIVHAPESGADGAPFVTSVTPPQGSVNSPIVIRGQGFQVGVSVKLGTAALSGLLVSADGTEIHAVVPQLPTGAADVTIENPDGRAFVKRGAFTVI